MRDPTTKPLEDALRPLDPGNLATASATLAAAFHEDPLFRFLFPPEETRPWWLRTLMGASLRMLLAEGHVKEGLP